MLWRITETPEAPQLHTTTALLSAPQTASPTPEFSSRRGASMPESLTANKIKTDTLLMGQNYIKSLKVDECTWQTIHFGGPVGREPGHLALTHLGKQNHLRCSRAARLAAAASHARCGAPPPSSHVFCSLNVFKLSDGWKWITDALCGSVSCSRDTRNYFHDCL